MAETKDVKGPVDPAQVDVKLSLGNIDHAVHLENDVIIHFKEGVAKVEKSIAKKLKELGITE